MDEDDGVPHLRRREPRTCVKNLRPTAYQDSLQINTEPKRSSKRKLRSIEDDPIYSEVDDADDSSDQQKKVPGYRCSPHLIPDLMKKLTPKQSEWVKKIDFGSFQDMIDSRMPKSLTMWLVDRVDTAAGSLDVGGIPVDIRDAVIRILKLPCGHLKVPPPLNGRSKAKRPKGDTSCLDQKYSVNGRGAPAKDEIENLLSIKEDEEEFCRSFVMVVLCIYAAPTTSLNINRNYLPSLLDVSKIRLMDWCGFIADYLIQAIVEFRDSKASHVQVPGCVHILPLMYIDTLIRLKALKLPKSLELPEGEPRIHFIGTQHLYMLSSLDVKSRRKDHVEFGLIMESCNRASGPAIKSQRQASSNLFKDTLPVRLMESLKNGEANKEPTSHTLASLFDEIEKSREELFEDFKRRVQLSDQKFFQKIELLFTDTNSKRANIIPEKDKDHSVTHAGEDQLNVPVIGRTDRKVRFVGDSVTPCCGESEKQIPSATPATTNLASDQRFNEQEILTPTAEISAIGVSKNCILNNSSTSEEPVIRCPQNGNVVSDNKTDPVSSDLDGEVHPTSTDHHRNLHSECVDSEQLSPAETPACESRPSTKPGKCVDCLNEVVDIGHAAADEATDIQKNDADQDGSIASLSVLRDAAVSQLDPKYDNSPATALSSSSTFVRPPGLESCKFALPVIQLFVRQTRSELMSEIPLDMQRPAFFDESPASRSVIENMPYRKYPASLLEISEEAAAVETNKVVSTCVDQVYLNDKRILGNSNTFDSSICKIPEGPARFMEISEEAPADGTTKVVSPYVEQVDMNKKRALGNSNTVDSSLMKLPKGYSSTVSTEVSASSRSLVSGDDEPSESDDASLQKTNSTDSDCNGFILTQNSTQSPGYSHGTQEVIEIPDDVVCPRPNDIIHLPPLQSELEGGARFKLGGSVSDQISKMLKRAANFEGNEAGGGHNAHYNIVLTHECKKTYKIHVSNSSARVSKRHRNGLANIRLGSKIQIKGFHLTNGEFVDCLNSNKGEVCQNFMGVCSVAMMCDWESKTKIILDQASVNDLLKSGHVCDHPVIAGRLRKYGLDMIEQIFLPILSDQHWILSVVDIPSETVQIYDSLLVVQTGAHPHKVLWKNLADNLERAYCLARSKSVYISFFECSYPGTTLQTNIHDCGFHVIRTLECHNTEDLVGYSKNKTMMSYRRYLSHVLIYHRFNDLNPLRPHLWQQLA